MHYSTGWMDPENEEGARAVRTWEVDALVLGSVRVADGEPGGDSSRSSGSMAATGRRAPACLPACAMTP